MGKLSKSRGKSYEYRVARWFQARKGWEQSFRIPLSGASQRIATQIADHDVLAYHSKPEIKIACECKKTGTDSIRLEYKWLEKLDFTTHGFDKLLIFAFDRSDHYVMIPGMQCHQLTGKVIIHGDPFEAKGGRFFTLHFSALQEAFKEKTYPSLYWKIHEENYCFMLLEDYIQARENYTTE